MNYVKINTFFDFDKIIYSEIIFTGSVDEEIEENKALNTQMIKPNNLEMPQFLL